MKLKSRDYVIGSDITGEKENNRSQRIEKKTFPIATANISAPRSAETATVIFSTVIHTPFLMLNHRILFSRCSKKILILTHGYNKYMTAVICNIFIIFSLS